jgi:hypothetical protein
LAPQDERRNNPDLRVITAFLLGSQNKSFIFKVPPTKHASWRAAPKPGPLCKFTHPYPNLPIRGRRGPPSFPPVRRRGRRGTGAETAVRRTGECATWVVGTRSTAEGAMEERGEEVVGLTQRLPLHCTEGLDPLHHLLKFRERYMNHRGGPISGRNRLPECGAPRYARFSTVWRSQIC